MRKTLLLSFIILCGTWVFAQTSSSTQNPTSTSSQATSSDMQTTVTGCLSGSSGNYTLTDKSGTAYQLAGDTSKLTDHVGHEISVTGTKSASSATSTSNTSSSSTSSGTSAPNTFNVSSFKHISETCPSKH